jgi:hypothetical protein
MTPTPLHWCWQHKNMGIKIKNPTQNQQWSRSCKICEGWGFVIIVCGGKDECGSISYFNTILHLSTSFLISLAFWSRKVAFHPTRLHPSIFKTPTPTSPIWIVVGGKTLISCTPPPPVHVTWIESYGQSLFVIVPPSACPLEITYHSVLYEPQDNNFIAPWWPIMSSFLLPPHVT